MKLVNLQADGLKNLNDVSLRVPKLLALSGQNGSGKTSLLTAIKLGVLGHDPDLGRTLAATRTISGGKGDIEVALRFDLFGVRRSIGRSMDTEVSPPRGEGTEKERQARIDAETGSFVASFDLRSMIEMSAEKQRAQLFGLLPRSLAKMEQDDYHEWLGYEDAADNVRKAIDKLWIEKITSDPSPTEGLASAIAFARDRFLEADRDRQAQEKVVKAADAEAHETTEFVIEESSDDLTALQLDAGLVQEDIGTLRQQQAEVERALRRRMEWEQRRMVLAERIQAGEEHVRKLLIVRDNLEIPPADALKLAEAKLRERSQAAAEAAARANQVVEAASAQASAAREATSAARAALGAAESRLTAAEAELQKLESYPECPVCGSTADLERARGRLREAVQAALESESEVAIAYDNLRGDLAEAEEVSTAAAAERRTAVAEVEHQLTEASVTVESARAAAECVRKASHDIRQAEQLLAGIKEESGILEARAVEEPATKPHEYDARIEAKEAEAFGYRQRIQKLQDIARAAGKAEAARERADRERAKLGVLEARSAALKKLYGALQKYRGHVIKQMVSPVEEVADELLQRIDPAKRFRFVFEREEKDAFEFGFEEDGVFRSYAAASTGEDAFLAVVYIFALVAVVGPAWRIVLLDNAEAIDDERRRHLMSAIAAVEDRVDNVIIAGCTTFPETDGWEVVDVLALTGRTLAEVA